MNKKITISILIISYIVASIIYLNLYDTLNTKTLKVIWSFIYLVYIASTNIFLLSITSYEKVKEHDKNIRRKRN